MLSQTVQVPHGDAVARRATRRCLCVLRANSVNPSKCAVNLSHLTLMMYGPTLDDSIYHQREQNFLLEIDSLAFAS